MVRMIKKTSIYPPEERVERLPPKPEDPLVGFLTVVREAVFESVRPVEEFTLL